jgi:hypothetical protein
MIFGAAILTMVLAPPVPSPVDLRWDAPAGCPDAQAIADSIARGIAPSQATVARMRAEVVVSQLDGEHWQAALDLRGADWTATRTLRGPTCAAVADAAGLLIVLAANTELQEREIVVPPPAPAPAPSPLSPMRPIGTPFISLGATADVGALPSPSVGGALSVGWRFARARIDLDASLFAPRQGTVAGHPDTGATFHLASAGLRGCYLLGGKLTVGPCLTGGVNRTRGTGFGPITPDEKTNTTGVLGGGLLAEWRLSRWVVPFVACEAAIPLVRPQFSVKDIGPVHRASPVSFRGAAGLELRFR